MNQTTNMATPTNAESHKYGHSNKYKIPQIWPHDKYNNPANATAKQIQQLGQHRPAKYSPTLSAATINTTFRTKKIHGPGDSTKSVHSQISIQLSKFFLCGLNQGCEAFCIVDGHFCQNLAVQLDVSLLQAVHQLAVG